MINDFSGFTGDYDSHSDDYLDRSNNLTDFNYTSEPITDDSFAEVIFFSMFENALLGVVEHANGSPSACYSQSASIEILKQEQGLSEEAAKIALNQLITTDLGPSSPCFLDTSIVTE